RRMPSQTRFRWLRVPSAWFGLGVSLPVAVFVAPSLASGSLGSLIHGVLIEPSARLHFAALRPPTLSSLPVTLVFLIAVLAVARGLSSTRLALRVCAAGALIFWFVESGTTYGYPTSFWSVRDASLFLVPVATITLARRLQQSTSTDATDT